MKCTVCGGGMHAIHSGMPFKIGHHAIVILKELPVLQCDTCREFLIEDPIMERVEVILEKADPDTELEVVRFAA